MTQLSSTEIGIVVKNPFSFPSFATDFEDRIGELLFEQACKDQGFKAISESREYMALQQKILAKDRVEKKQKRLADAFDAMPDEFVASEFAIAGGYQTGNASSGRELLRLVDAGKVTRTLGQVGGSRGYRYRKVS